MSLTVRPVAGRRELKKFVKLPFRLYRDSRNWVPPLIRERMKFLDREKNIFFRHAEAEYFLAECDGRIVGRICAHIDRNFQDFQKTSDGFFGFFECERDGEVARALMETACDWLRERGCDRAIGPMEFTTNDECGLLIEGFDTPPTILCEYHHPYYRELLESAGFNKAMDLLMWELITAERPKVMPIIMELAEKLETEQGIRLRNMDKRHFADELAKFQEVYNSAWERNWGFVPLTSEEVVEHANELKPLLDPDFAWFAEKADGEVVGAALTLPNYNLVLKRMNGRLFPFGLLKFLYYRRKLDEFRVFTLGVKREYRHTGIAAAMYKAHFDAAEARSVKRAETGWILETNGDMNRAMEAMGGKVIHRYRVFQKDLV